MSRPTSDCIPSTDGHQVSNLTYWAYAGSWIAANWTRPLALPAYQLQYGYLDIPTGPTNVIAAISWQASAPSYSACGPLKQHNASGTLSVTLIPSPSSGSGDKKKLTKTDKIAIAAAVGVVVLVAAVALTVWLCRRARASGSTADKVSGAADDELYARLN